MIKPATAYKQYLTPWFNHSFIQISSYCNFLKSSLHLLIFPLNSPTCKMIIFTYEVCNKLCKKKSHIGNDMPCALQRFQGDMSPKCTFSRDVQYHVSWSHTEQIYKILLKRDGYVYQSWNILIKILVTFPYHFFPFSFRQFLSISHYHYNYKQITEHKKQNITIHINDELGGTESTSTK